jgi:hypothetical protein
MKFLRCWYSLSLLAGASSPLLRASQTPLQRTADPVTELRRLDHPSVRGVRVARGRAVDHE